LVLYQPQLQQQQLLDSLCSSVQPLLQQPNHALPTPLPLQQQQQPDLDTGHNDNAALKSVWRTLTPAQRRSLAGMWDVIKTEHLLPRLAPASGLLPLPSTDIDSDQQQRWQPQQSCIIEELEDTGADKQQQQQQQQQAVANGFAPPVTRNGFAAAAADLGSADMQVDQQQQIPATRVPSVEDMEL
jgi:hypothetical protein